ncbi:MAG: sigma 54-interacting transcriptional regulator [Deltaproteobacteria bacterium]|nr:sigma 54-interacting transcriptional regulator [Deltaproteobacteria bacterium]MBK8241128.1 sigma 54-interacting transcriptional regulator [Deltaproteobacteria bacterium]MBK8716949.1 sigma 54-interacting transcriptional regulator [Deltaproteobacteria bacterium]MBP7291266.1 sigma 54-interacting transcriptional regulator [Nannocystaceae bacterium]
MHAAEFAPNFPESIADARLRQAPPVYLGHSAAARRVQAMIQRAVRTNLPVLLVGAAGTGKENIARILHHFGGGEVPTLEVVRGNEQPRLMNLGAFTYLSRLEDLPLEEQARLPALTGLGRIVIGTRLRPESDEGRARLHPQIVRWASGIRIDVPTLAERIEDLEQHAMDIIAKTAAKRAIGGIADNALDCLRSYRWPGNLDELAEVLTAAINAGNTELIELRDLPSKLRVRDVHHARAESPERQLCLEESEKQAIRRALNYARGNKRKAARLLHIGKTTLYRKLKQYDLE